MLAPALLGVRSIGASSGPYRGPYRALLVLRGSSIPAPPELYHVAPLELYPVAALEPRTVVEPNTDAPTSTETSTLQMERPSVRGRCRARRAMASRSSVIFPRFGGSVLPLQPVGHRLLRP